MIVRDLFHCRCCLIVSTAILAVALIPHPARCDEDEAAKLFHEQVAPLLEKNCVECHNVNTRKGGLSIETLADVVKGGDQGPAIAPGKPLDSSLYVKIVPASAGEKPEMPQKKPPLTDEETSKVRRWIESGAPWPKEIVLKEKSKADGTFWSFQPLASVEPPEVADAPESWRAHPIDRFVFAKLREKGLTPNPPAEPRDFIRRATFDLIGLPPTPEEITQFEQAVKQDRSVAIEQLIDRLLSSPHYGQRWGRHWLDVVRFGESRGYERNEIITNLWPFRDYVIDSLNADKPFNRFIAEHLAGDVLAPDDPSVLIGSAFLVAGPYDDVGNQDPKAAAQIRADQMDEMIRATGEAFLGLTLGCARCHDHKFDPLKSQDYYAFYATFAGVVHGPREIKTPAQEAERNAKLQPLQAEKQRLEKERDELKKKLMEAKATPEEIAAKVAEIEKPLLAVNMEIGRLPTFPTWWVGTRRGAPGPFHIFLGGSPEKKADVVSPGSLSVLADRASSYRLEQEKPEHERRLALANWITADDNPLTTRVLANRVWHYHFGRGIVDTPSDFGYMGGRPTHPELLDWLSRQLLANGWKLKPLHKLIMTSQAYQQSAGFREDAARQDGDSRLLWRFPPRRLSAEEIRDTLLSVAGKLDTRMGGPGFRLYEYQQDNVATYVPLNAHGPETYRRAIYHHNARAARIDILTDFDSPDPAVAEPRRASTTTPLQALTLMNHRFMLDMAGAFAQRIERATNGADVRSRVQRGFVVAFGREPDETELAAGAKLVEAHGLPAFCRVLLNTSELINLQ